MDITDMMNEYRECVRNLWNTHLLDKIDPECLLGYGVAPVSTGHLGIPKR